MATLADIDRIEDEDTLESLINQTEDLNIRRQIRKRQKEIREKRMAAYEASKANNKRETATEMRLRMAAEDKERKMKEFESKAKEQKAAAPDIIKERQDKADAEKQKKLDQFQEMAKTQSSMANAGVANLLKKDTLTPQTSQGQFGVKPQATGSFGGGGVVYGDGASKVARNPTSVKDMLLEWCKKQVEGYEHVNITNFGSSWADGMAFCALIHHFVPHTFDYSKLNPKNRRGNFKLAFTVAEKEADIPALLDVEDMVRMKTPDWKCVFTYVQGFYRRFGMPQKQP